MALGQKLTRVCFALLQKTLTSTQFFTQGLRINIESILLDYYRLEITVKRFIYFHVQQYSNFASPTQWPRKGVISEYLPAHAAVARYGVGGGLHTAACIHEQPLGHAPVALADKYPAS